MKDKLLNALLILASMSFAIFAFAATAAHASPSSTSVTAQACVHDTPLTAHNRTVVEAHLIRTCAHDFQAYGDWQNVGYKFGPPKRTGYDDVCAHSGCSSGGGTLFEAGVRRVSDGRLFCEYGCASTTASPAMHYHGIQTVTDAATT